jgi:hypothetical protein
MDPMVFQVMIQENPILDYFLDEKDHSDTLRKEDSST